MRLVFSILYSVLVVALATCAVMARKSRKVIGRSVSTLTVALIPPVIGNLIIIVSDNQMLSTFGYYVYFLGMDLVMVALLRFTFAYCALSWPNTKVRNLFYAIVSIDVVQFLLNPLFGQAFDTEPVLVGDMAYYRLIPHTGQTFHRVLDYTIFLIVISIFLIKTVRSPRITAERYSLILISMVVIGLWQTFYIFSRTPVDRSMIGYGVFGLLIYYFSLRYRAMRLLDRMLATIASQLPEALFFFDSNGACIWANDHGKGLLDIDSDLDQTSERLDNLFGVLDTSDEWSTVHTIGSGDDMKSYVMERRTITDSKGRVAGSFLSIRDNSDEQRMLQREIYNAAHDSLTKVYNRAGYDLLVSEMDLATTCMILLDIDFFKTVNDTFGHEMGDKVLQKLARIVAYHFRSEDHVSRIGGDEFVVLMAHANRRQSSLISERIRQINDDLADTTDGLPPVSISVGVAYGCEASTPNELFSHADHALYDTKRHGRNGYTFYAA